MTDVAGKPQDARAEVLGLLDQLLREAVLDEAEDDEDRVGAVEQRLVQVREVDPLAGLVGTARHDESLARRQPTPNRSEYRAKRDRTASVSMPKARRS